MKIKDWLTGMDYQLLQGSLDEQVDEVVYDSRKASPGAVFVCIRGAKVDSHQFCGQVYEQGARVIVAERPVEADRAMTVIQVKNTRAALAKLSAARFGHPLQKMVSIGVTGTKGKTTTTHMIKAILEQRGEMVGMIGTNGVFIGQTLTPTINTTPESYELHQFFAQMVEAGCRYLVMEASSQAFKMDRTYGIVYDYGIFTNISPDHIGPDEHADFAEYLACKAQLFSQCRYGLINADDAHGARLISRATAKLYSFGLHTQADFMAQEIAYLSQDDFVGLSFLVTGRLNESFQVNMPGKFNVYNALAAISVCSLLGFSPDSLKAALKKMTVDGRMEIAYASARCQVIVDYAHNAVSMESLLKTLRDYHPKRLVVVFGCGGNRAKDRRHSMGEMAGKLADLSILTADNSRFEQVEEIIGDIKAALVPTGGQYLEIPDRKEAITYAITHAREGDMIAVIGKGHEDYQEVNGVRTHFKDREIIDEVVKTLNQ